MKNKIIPLILLLLVLGFFHTQPARAQETTPATGPIYIIQPGDSLSGIASRFNIRLDDLLRANDITDPNAISAGARLVIPGLEGVTGILATEIIGYGETLQNISRRNQVPESALRRINRLTSPSELYAGISVIVPQNEGALPLTNRTAIQTGQSLLEAAVLAGTDGWSLQEANDLAGSWAALPGDMLYFPGAPAEGITLPNGMPSAFQEIKVEPLPMTQGRTSEIIIRAPAGTSLSGILADKPLTFFPLEDGRQVAIQGVHALLEPGPYPLKVEASLPNGEKQSFEQFVVIQSGYYPEDPLLLVEPETIDPATTESELAQIEALTAGRTPQRYWQGLFLPPGYDPTCFTSRYGSRRTYLGQGTDLKYYSFHTGLDFCGGTGLPIAAPASGIIVFAGPLSIRGNATIIDHGWGIYSGFWHQSEIKVQVGQTVQKGDIIGVVGGTGRVTGAHLHWEVWAGGIQVNPFDWMEQTYP
jgi:murein DD-endopeptidase MepM/ murein hydrolase activator NlpD